MVWQKSIKKIILKDLLSQQLGLITFIKNTCFKLKSNHHLIRRNAANDSKYEGLLDGMKFEVFEKLLRKCLQESIFIFNDKVYQQIDGVSMGSPLGPILANIFMNHFENNHFEELVKKGSNLGIDLLMIVVLL